MRVMIGIPSARDWKSATATTFALAYADLCNAVGKDNCYIYNQFATPNLPDAREKMVKEAIKDEFTHLIFFDDDMKISPSSFVRLLKHDKDCIGIDYSKKCVQPYSTTACGTKDVNYKRFHNMIGVQPAGNMGFGCVAIKVEALKKLKSPMFMPRWNEESQKYTTEDTPFFEQLIEKGVQPHVDLDLSRHCAHIGDCEYTIRDVHPDAIEDNNAEVKNSV